MCHVLRFLAHAHGMAGGVDRALIFGLYEKKVIPLAATPLHFSFFYITFVKMYTAQSALRSVFVNENSNNKDIYQLLIVQ